MTEPAAEKASVEDYRGEGEHGKGRFRPPLTISRQDYLDEGRGDTGFRETIYVLVQSLGRLVACREAFARQMGLTANQFAILIGTAYLQNDEGVTIRDLSRHIVLAPTHVTTGVGRLTRLGLLAKRPNARDRRSVLVSLSPPGQQAVERIAPLVREVNDLLFDGISAEDLCVMNRTAHLLLKNSDLAAAAIRKAADSDA